MMAVFSSLFWKCSHEGCVSSWRSACPKSTWPSVRGWKSSITEEQDVFELRVRFHPVSDAVGVSMTSSSHRGMDQAASFLGCDMWSCVLPSFGPNRVSKRLGSLGKRCLP